MTSSVRRRPPKGYIDPTQWDFLPPPVHSESVPSSEVGEIGDASPAADAATTPEQIAVQAVAARLADATAALPEHLETPDSDRLGQAESRPIADGVMAIPEAGGPVHHGEGRAAPEPPATGPTPVKRKNSKTVASADRNNPASAEGPAPDTPSAAPPEAKLADPLAPEPRVNGVPGPARGAHEAEESLAPPLALRPRVDTLADVLRVLDLLPASSEREKSKRANLRTAVNMIGKVLGKPLDRIPADPAQLAMPLHSANPATVRMRLDRWATVCSRLGTAMRLAGVDVLPGRDVRGLSSAWKELSAKLQTQKLRYGLSRLLSYLSGQGLAPGDVNASMLEDFRLALERTSLEPSPLAAANTFARLWNEAAHEVVGWPAVRMTVVPDPRRFSLEWSEFTESFRADVDAFLAHTGDQDPLADTYADSVRETTIKGRRKMIRMLATGLIASGFPSAELTDLGVLVKPENAKRALRVLVDRQGGQKSWQVSNETYLLATIARYWVKADAADIKKLQAFKKGVTPKKTGMTEKNRDRMRQFDNPANVSAVLDLPRRVFAEAKKNDSGRKSDAVRVMRALAVELLTVSALRIRNINGLEVERHLLEVRRGGKVRRHIVIPKAETKTSEPFEMALSDETSALLEAYLKTYRDRVCPHPSIYLFPGRDGRLRSVDTFAGELSEFVRREAGVTMNVHMFRHFAVYLYLKAVPGDMQTASKMLLHTSDRTTRRAYALWDTAEAFRRYDHVIDQHRKSARRPAARKLTRRPGSTSSADEKRNDPSHV